MTGGEILNQSLRLLGYSESNGNAHLTQTVINRALPIINLVYAELARNCEQEFKPLESLSGKLDLPDKAINEVMPSGVAMYIANAEGDSAAEAFWGAEYNAKRVTLSHFGEIKDVLPNVWG
jgi:hypothetical protein